jgi:hypothetical protein
MGDLCMTLRDGRQPSERQIALFIIAYGDHRGRAGKPLSFAKIISARSGDAIRTKLV